MVDRLPATARAGALSAYDNHPSLWAGRMPRPGWDTHKHARGHLMCVSGGLAQTGAARLAARAGLRIGAGLVSLLSPPDALSVNAAHLTAIMLRRFDDTDGLLDVTGPASALVIGPAAGVSEETRANVLALLRVGKRLVLDADALTVFEGNPKSLFRDLTPHCVLTPHAGEFERLFPGLAERYADRRDAARAAAEAAGCTVLLKGAETIIGHPGEVPVVNRHASPYLATAGSGDVLAGVIGGLIAQGMAGLLAAQAAAWLHGEAGRRLGPGLIAEDLPEALPGILADLFDSDLASPPNDD